MKIPRIKRVEKSDFFQKNDFPNPDQSLNVVNKSFSPRKYMSI